MTIHSIHGIQTRPHHFFLPFHPRTEARALALAACLRPCPGDEPPAYSYKFKLAAVAAYSSGVSAASTYGGPHFRIPAAYGCPHIFYRQYTGGSTLPSAYGCPHILWFSRALALTVRLHSPGPTGARNVGLLRYGRAAARGAGAGGGATRCGAAHGRGAVSDDGITYWCN